MNKLRDRRAGVMLKENEYRTIETMAEDECRSISSMLRMLLLEALEARAKSPATVMRFRRVRKM